jgi:hypothetical protein
MTPKPPDTINKKPSTIRGEAQLATLDSLIETLNAAGLERRTTELNRQARLVAEGCGRSTPLGDDIESVKDAYAHKFERRDP